MSNSPTDPGIERQSLEVDIACVGFGPAMGGFLTTLSRSLVKEDGTPLAESKAMPGMPLQVICYERADDIGVGVSGVVTKASHIQKSFPDRDLSTIPMAAPVTQEKVAYLFDPIGASRRSKAVKAQESMMRAMKGILKVEHEALELPYIPPFLCKHPGFVLSLGQFNQWVGSELMGSGLVQIWPGMPVKEPLIDGGRVVGLRLMDQGTDKQGRPEAGFMPGMDIKAGLTVVGDGPVGAVGRELDRQLGMPAGNHQREWALGMKMVVDLPQSCTLEPGAVIHTLGYPEPEIFGFMYVYPDRVASLGIFVPSWFDSPTRTAYRYLQHWMQHPYLWRYLSGGRMRSWGAKSLQESGKRGEPILAGDGFARIGEGSGSTNVLTGSGVDEAWGTGVMLAEAVINLAKEGKSFTRENLEATYVTQRRASDLERQAKVAAKSRDGFSKGFLRGLFGMALAGFTKGAVNWPAEPKRPQDRIPSIEAYYKGTISPEEIERIRQECLAAGKPLHGGLMDKAGWPSIVYDGQILVSHQDALLMGGKVQAPAGYQDHVRFADKAVCETCLEKVCIEMCSGQAITTNPEGGVPLFDREKCVYCGACLWNCSKTHPKESERTNVEFTSGSGGLHSVEN